MERSIQNEVSSNEKVQNIQSTSFSKLDSLLSITFENTKEYSTLNTELQWWKQRAAMSGKDRIEINKNIQSLQNNLQKRKDIFEKNKQSKISLLQKQQEQSLQNISNNTRVQQKKYDFENFISIVFVCMVLIIEILIVFLAREFSILEHKKQQLLKSPISQQFLIRYKILTDTLLRKGRVELNDIKYSPYLKLKKGDEFFNNHIKPIYSLFVELKITEGGVVECQKKLKNYYETLLNI